MVVSGTKRESVVSARRSSRGASVSGLMVGGGGKYSFERKAVRALRSCSGEFHLASASAYIDIYIYIYICE